ncbi:MAG TPA: hypothetical protein VGO31_11810 [Microbacteriaceae bacterium]|jgi:hypothetical protein|nr:hypothetical protein [Microbacteriaceae bacterium]
MSSTLSAGGGASRVPTAERSSAGSAPDDEGQRDLGAVPTEDCPQVGDIGTVIDGRRYLIATVDHWVEDGLEVFRARDFDCIAMDEDLQIAVDLFVSNVFDLVLLLNELADQGQLVDDEARLLSSLTSRLTPMMIATKREATRDRSSVFRRIRSIIEPSREANSWQAGLSGRSTSSTPLHA